MAPQRRHNEADEAIERKASRAGTITSARCPRSAWRSASDISQHGRSWKTLGAGWGVPTSTTETLNSRCRGQSVN
jgi:hypothetical protein